MPFDRNIVRQEAEKQLRAYFADIASVLPSETNACRFKSFAFRDFSAFVEPLSTGTLISIDEQWSLFLFAANILLCVRACKVLTSDQKASNTDLFRQNLLILADPWRHETVREAMRPVFHDHADVLPLANLLTKAMYGFMICHEVAHASLGHLQQEAPDCDDELEADRVGLGYLLRVCKRFQSLKSFKVAPNIIGAPVIAMRYLRFLEVLGLIETGSDSHPNATARTECLREVFNKVACDEAKYLLSGMDAACDELLKATKD